MILFNEVDTSQQAEACGDTQVSNTSSKTWVNLHRLLTVMLWSLCPEEDRSITVETSP